MRFTCPRCGAEAKGDRNSPPIRCENKVKNPTTGKREPCGWTETVNERAVEWAGEPSTVIEPRGGPDGAWKCDPVTGEPVEPPKPAEEEPAADGGGEGGGTAGESTGG